MDTWQSNGDGAVNRENIALKRSFVIQSFAPLFLLLTIKHLDIKIYVKLINKFFEVLLLLYLKIGKRWMKEKSGYERRMML